MHFAGNLKTPSAAETTHHIGHCIINDFNIARINMRAARHALIIANRPLAIMH